MLPQGEKERMLQRHLALRRPAYRRLSTPAAMARINSRLQGHCDDRQPRILFVLPGLSAGGSERVVSGLANRWAERGWEISVACFEPSTDASYYSYRPDIRLIALGFPSRREPPLRAASAMAGRIKALRRAMTQISPDLVISFLTRTNVLSVLAATGLGFPVIVSERNNPSLQQFGPVWDWLRRRTYRRAFGLVTMTQGALDFFPPAMRRRGWVVPNPVELPDLPSRRPTGRSLVAVGRLVRQKGFDLLLESFARIAPAVPGWTLTIWGEGPDRAALERQRDALGLRDIVRFPGVTERPGEWVAGADIFILSSRYEGWGIVLLEAMAAGIPCVSFDCQWGPREMIEDGSDGLIVPPEDVGAMAEAIARLIGDRALRERIGEAARLSAQRFAPEKVIARWDGVVADAIGTPAPADCGEGLRP